MALARRLAADGVKATFAVNDLANVHLVAKRDEFAILQSPVWPDHRHWGHRPSIASYADILTGIGFADSAKLSTMMSAWHSLLELVKPDLVVADHSPALLAALHGTGMPVVTVGTPFTMPPLTLDRLPPLRADQAPSLPEPRLHQSLKAAMTELGLRPPARMVDLFRSNERLVFGMPELDPYRAFRDEPILTPPEPLPAFVEAPVKPRLFVYAGSEVPHLETLVQGLVEMDIDIVAYLRGDVGPLPYFLKHRGHKVYDTPPPLDEVLPGSTVHDPVNQVISSEELRCLVDCLSSTLSELESRVLALYLDGNSYEHIGERIGCDTKTVDNALQRVKRKVGAHLQTRNVVL